ncbi:sperm acrosome-associated protein 7-like isoform X2 [Dipodomys merriami]|uniref:sperm acrosome-associated protein 7-like isoform X2 n=1 Tax=Dipodomys merriami TaxID=94247 RepID=UPI0038559364
MATSRGAWTLSFVLLLCRWQEVQHWPIKIQSESSSALPPKLKSLDDDVATVFDEILVQELLDPNKSVSLERPKPLTSQPPQKKILKEMYETNLKKKQEKQLTSGKMNRLSFDEEKEILFQIKSLTALEKIIDSLRRAIGSHLKNTRKLHKIMLKARANKGKSSIE